jgi:uncharacterized membrane protein
MWLILSIATAVFLALRDFQVKRYALSLDPLTLSWGLYLFSSPILLIPVIICGLPEISGQYFYALFIAGSCDAIAALLYVHGLKSGDLSKAIPMMSFIPVFQLFIAPLILSEYPSMMGVVGVFIVVTGAYLINISKETGGLFGPFYGLLRDRSCQMMLGVALLWSISIVYHKIGVQSSSNYFWVFSVTVFIGIVLYPLVHIFAGQPWKKMAIHSKNLVLPAVFHALTLGALYGAIALAQVAYVSSIRRLSILISIIFGIFLLKEDNLRPKLIGGSIMVAGAIIITVVN